MSSPYPPEPWTLRARMALSTFLVPPSDLPEASWPAGHRPVVVGGRVPVGAAWVVYEPGGVLDYRELLVAVLLRRGARVLPSVSAIWVDSAASRAGGRELWGIPKEMATFADDPARPSCTPRGSTVPVAHAEVTLGRVLPAGLPVGFSVVQQGHAATALVSPVRTRSRWGTASVRWSFDPDGELGFLAGRQPAVSIGLHDVDMLFGMTPTDRARQQSVITSSQV